MQAFSFPAQALLNLRRILLRQAELRLAQAQADYRRAQQRRYQSECQLRDLAVALRQAIQQGTAGQAFWMLRHRVESAVTARERATAECQQWLEACQHHRQRVLALRRDVEALQTLRQSAWRAYRRRWQRDQQRQADEHAQQRWCGDHLEDTERAAAP